MTRDELIDHTARLIDEGDRLEANPSMGGLRLWLQRSDDLLAEAWGSLDRYHLTWLMVGKPKEIVRGRLMTSVEEAAYVREVARQKTAALRMSFNAVARQGMGEVPSAGREGRSRFGLPAEADDLAARVRAAREEAARRAEADDRPRAPRPERMQH